MKYVHIAAALGWEETPDHQEGLFLQPEEASLVDKALGKTTSDDAALTAAQGTIQQLTDEVNTLKTSSADTQSKLDSANARITELEAENKKLGSQSSGTGTVLSTTEDPEHGKGKVPSYLSDDNPANQWIDQKIGKK